MLPDSQARSLPSTCHLSLTPFLAQSGSCWAVWLPVTASDLGPPRATLSLEHVGGSVLTSSKSGRSQGSASFRDGEADISPGSPGCKRQEPTPAGLNMEANVLAHR